ncbi:MAG: hypothetical protein RL372_703 [Bacteroidota bacterium]|jgi:hypothetical protein
MRVIFKNSSYFLIAAIAFLALPGCLFAQTIASKSAPGIYNLGGGTSKITPNFIVDWSIGESTIIETFFGRSTQENLLLTSKSFVTSGVLQPTDWFHIPVLRTETLRLDEVRVYPVPAKNFVNLDFRSGDIGYFYVSLYDNSGKIIETKEMVKSEKPISQNWNISKLASGIYYFKVLVRPNSYKIEKSGVFKFQKIN